MCTIPCYFMRLQLFLEEAVRGEAVISCMVSTIYYINSYLGQLFHSEPHVSVLTISTNFQRAIRNVLSNRGHMGDVQSAGICPS